MVVKILVCGGRDFANLDEVFTKRFKKSWEESKKEYQFVLETLEKLSRKYSKNLVENDNWLPTDITIISGMAKGADTAGADWAALNYAKLDSYPADWNKYKKSAGPIRNQQMIDGGKPDLVVAFPGGTGTADMIRRAKKHNIEVIEIEYD